MEAATARERLKPQAGVTLMELLIAVSLVSVLSTGMLMAIRVGLNAMQKTNSRFAENRRFSSVQRLIESQIGGFMPVVSECRGGGGGGRFLFFEGRPQSMRFVSSYSLQEAARGYPRILSFAVVRGDQGYRLIVNESIYPGPIGAGLQCLGLRGGVPDFAETSANPQSFVLADKLAYCRILYRQTLPLPELEKWTDVWTFPERMPSAVRIDMAPLRPDPAKINLQPVTVPLRVNKWVLGPYVDQ